LPILFFGTLARTPVETVLDPALMAGFSLVVLATFVVGMLSTRLAVRGGLAKMSLQGIAASWGNVGYMGVPLCLAAFGEQGLPPPPAPGSRSAWSCPTSRCARALPRPASPR